MSNRPGIGALFMDEVASSLMEHEWDEDDVPVSLAHGKGRYKPLGRYLRQQLRLKVGRSKDVPEEAKKKVARDMSEMQEFAWANGLTTKEVLKALSADQIERLEALHEMKSTIRKKL